MADQSPHWTDNEEILERYVLGRIEPQAKRILELHLEECERCREAVRREQELAAGVRRLGRETLKAELAKRLGTRTRAAIPWPHVISAAAVFVIAVGVALYAFWTPIETWYEESMTQSLPEAREKAEEAKVLEEPAPEAAGRDDLARRNENFFRKMDEAKGEEQKLVEAPAVVDQAEPISAELEDKEKDLADVGATTHVSAWVQGVIVPTPEAAGAAQPRAKGVQERRADEVLKAAPAEARKARGAEAASGLQAVTAELRQQPFERLPEEKQQLQLAQTQRTVETLVEKIPEGLRLTLFLDPPVPEQELQEAELRPVADDSLLVVMSTLQIAFKIPPAFGSVQGIQIKTK